MSCNSPCQNLMHSGLYFKKRTPKRFDWFTNNEINHSPLESEKAN